MFFKNKWNNSLSPKGGVLPSNAIPQGDFIRRSGQCRSCRQTSVTNPYISLGKQPASQPIMYGPFQHNPYPTNYSGNN